MFGAMRACRRIGRANEAHGQRNAFGTNGKTRVVRTTARADG
jgi:hypothetical protein